MARRLTLHEIAAVGCLIRRHGDELAERYEQHQIVESPRQLASSSDTKSASGGDRFLTRL